MGSIRKLITHGSIVTGNPVEALLHQFGTYMLNYKETGSTLRRPGYETSVTYWMPFNGNIEYMMQLEIFWWRNI